MEDYVIKQVDVERQPHLVDKLPELQEMYKATKVSKHLIRSEEGLHVGSKYTVTLSPFGEQLGSGAVSTRVSSLTQLQAAIRCVLLALQDLHAASFAHTDIWWPNVIKCSCDAYYLIDLEMAVKLDCTWSGWRPRSPPQRLDRKHFDQRQVHSRVRLGVGRAIVDGTWATTPW